MKKIVSLILVLLIFLSVFAISEPVFEVYVSSKGGTLHLRRGPGTNTESLGIVKHGDKVSIVEAGDEWTQIFVPSLGKTGYLKTKYLIPAGESDSPSSVAVVPAAAERQLLPGAFQIDLNGDSRAERIVFKTLTDEYGTEYLHMDIYENSVNTAKRDFTIAYDASVYFAKLDSSNRIYMLISGDECSSDYIAECWYYENRMLKAVPFENAYPFSEGTVFPGSVNRVENGIITLGPVLDILGTRFYTCDFYLNNGSIRCAGTPVWRCGFLMSDPETWEYVSLTSVCDLPCTAYGAPETLEAGTRILVTAVDALNSTIYFVTEYGMRGEFSYQTTVGEYGWGIQIGSIHEQDAFEYVPYAG